MYDQIMRREGYRFSGAASTLGAGDCLLSSDNDDAMAMQRLHNWARGGDSIMPLICIGLKAVYRSKAKTNPL